MNKELSTKELITPYKDSFSYQLVELTPEQKSEEYPGSTGILIDGTTIRIDDLSIGDSKDPVLDIKYKIVEGVPENLEELESKLTAAVIELVNAYVKED